MDGQQLDPPIIKEHGEGWNFHWPNVDVDGGWVIEIDRLQEQRQGIQAEVNIVTGESRSHLHVCQINLMATTTRNSLAKHLTGRNDSIRWHDMLEIACAHSIREFRKGEPVLNIAQQPPAGKPEWLISRLLPKGETTVLFADGGSGKSYLALGLSLSVTTGEHIHFALKPTTTTNVLYLDWETHPKEIRRRVEWLCKGYDVDPIPNLFYRQGMRRLADDAARLRQEVEDRNIGLVVVDSIAPAIGGEPENAAEVIRAFNVLRSLKNTTRLVLAHVSKSTAANGGAGSKPFGSVFHQNLGRSIWEMRMVPGEFPGLGLYQRKTNYKPDSRPIGLKLIINDAEEEAFFAPMDIDDEPELAAHAPASHRIRASVTREALTIEQIHKATGLPANQIRARVASMAGVGMVGKTNGHRPQNLYGLLATT